MIEIQIDSSAIEKGIRQLSQMPIALKAALNKAAKRAGTSIKNLMTERATQNYFIKSSKVRQHITMRYSQEKLEIFADARKRLLSSYYLSPRKRPKTRQHGLYGAVKRTGGSKFIPRGFLLKDNLPFHRIGKARDAIEPVYSPSIAQIVGHPEDLKQVAEYTKESFIKNFNHEVAYRLGRFKS